MALNENFRFVSTVDSIASNELNQGINIELETFFDSVMSAVVDYFEEGSIK